MGQRPWISTPGGGRRRGVSMPPRELGDNRIGALISQGFGHCKTPGADDVVKAFGQRKCKPNCSGMVPAAALVESRSKTPLARETLLAQT